MADQRSVVVKKANGRKRARPRDSDMEAARDLVTMLGGIDTAVQLGLCHGLERKMFLSMCRSVWNNAERERRA